jgi:tetratricopeptide (TPR) repeat protein
MRPWRSLEALGGLVLAVAVASASTLEHPESSRERELIQGMREAWQLAEKGQRDEARRQLEALSGQLDDLTEPFAGQLRERLARAMEALGDTSNASTVRSSDSEAAVNAPKPEDVPAASTVLEGASAADLVRIAQDPGTDSEMARRCFADALAILEKQESPDGADLKRRGLCLEALGRDAEAVAALEASLKHSPDDPYLRFALARLAWKARDRVRASQLLGEGLSSSLDLDGTRLLVEMFKDQVARGERTQAMASCRDWLDRCGAIEAMVPLQLFLAPLLEEDRQLERSVRCYAAAIHGGGAVAAGGLARTLRAMAGQGPKQLQQVVGMLRGLVIAKPGTPGCLLLAAAELSVQAGDCERGLKYLQAGYRGGERETFIAALNWLHGEAQARQDEALCGRIDDVLKRERPVQSAARSPTAKASDMLADTVFEALLKARQTGSGVENALSLAVSASLEPLGPGLPAATSADVNNSAIWSGNSSFPQRYTLLEPYLKGDLKQTMFLLGSMVPGLVVPRPVPAKPEKAAGPALITPPRTLRPPPPPVEVTEETPPPPPVEVTKEPPPPPPPVATPVPIRRAIETAVRALGSSQTTERERLTCLIEVARRLSSPILIDLGGIGHPELSNTTDPSGAVRFDLDGSGVPSLIQWTSGRNTGWLCEDLDGDGRISSGLELFGTAGGFRDGFAKLGLLDRNQDGVISGRELSGLSVWVDGNRDGRCDAGELTPLSIVGVEAISLPRSGYESTLVIAGKPHRCWDIWPTVFRVDR